MVKVIIFDLWKTLAEKNDSMVKKLCYEFNIKQNKNTIFKYEKSVQLKEFDNIKNMAISFLKEFKIELSEENINKAEFIFKHEYDNEFLYKGVKTLLSKLKKDYKLVLLSNSTYTIKSHFNELNISKYFDEIIFSFEIGYIKPNEKAFKYVIDLMNVNYNECLLVDDNINNINQAKKLGMKVYHFDNVENLNKFLKQKSF